MIKINSVEQIKNISGDIYVRWSKSIALDNKRGYSLAYGTQAERGLSACKIDQEWDEWRILRQLSEYIFCGGSCWLVTGDEVGRGQDNEELLINVMLIGKVSDELTSSDWLKMWRDALLASEQERATVSGDEWNRTYAADLVEKLSKQDRKLWQRIMNYGR